MLGSGTIGSFGGTSIAPAMAAFKVKAKTGEKLGKKGFAVL